MSLHKFHGFEHPRLRAGDPSVGAIRAAEVKIKDPHAHRKRTPAVTIGFKTRRFNYKERIVNRGKGSDRQKIKDRMSVSLEELRRKRMWDQFNKDNERIDFANWLERQQLKGDPTEISPRQRASNLIGQERQGT